MFQALSISSSQLTFTGQSLVEEALTLLRKIDPSPTRYRTSQNAAVAEDTETPRGILGSIEYYLKQILSVFLFHNPISLEEPEDGRVVAGLGLDKWGRHPKQLRTAVEYLESAANEGNGDAMYLLAQMNFYGNWSHPRNYKRALRLYKQLADMNGNSTAQHMVGFMYATGFRGGCERDQAKVFRVPRLQSRVRHSDG